MFQPKVPSVKRAKAIAFATGSDSPTRSTLPEAFSTCSSALSEIADSPPRTYTGTSSWRFRASIVGSGTESRWANSTGSPLRAAQAAAGIATAG